MGEYGEKRSENHFLLLTVGLTVSLKQRRESKSNKVENWEHVVFYHGRRLERFRDWGG